MTHAADLRDVMERVLLATFAADALGGAWEGAGPVPLDQARRRLAASLEPAVLRYTDDTQLTLALAEHLCEHPDVDPPALVATFLAHFEDWRGYARGMHGLVAAWQRGLTPDAAATSVFPDGSFGNGAAMRVAPVGVLHAGNPDRTRLVAQRQAAVTHAHPIGVDAAVAQAAAVATAVTRGAFTAADVAALAAAALTPAVREALETAAAQVRRWGDAPDPVAVAAAIGTDVRASESVAAALWIAAVAADLEQVVVLALALGGDIDTIAAMAGAVVAAAGAEVPALWRDKLEDGPRGRSYAVGLAARLAGTGSSGGPARAGG